MKKNRSAVTVPLMRRRAHAGLGQVQLEAAQLLGVAVSGERPRKAVKVLDVRGCSRWRVVALKLRTVMSSIMRRRSGLMGVSLIGGSCLEVRLDTPRSSRRDAAPSPQSVQPITTAARRARTSRVQPLPRSGFVP